MVWSAAVWPWAKLQGPIPMAGISNVFYLFTEALHSSDDVGPPFSPPLTEYNAEGLGFDVLSFKIVIFF